MQMNQELHADGKVFHVKDKVRTILTPEPIEMYVTALGKEQICCRVPMTLKEEYFYGYELEVIK